MIQIWPELISILVNVREFQFITLPYFWNLFSSSRVKQICNTYCLLTICFNCIFVAIETLWWYVISIVYLCNQVTF